MIYLLLSIITSTLFAISFKVIANKQVNAFQAIIVNYFSACVMGFYTTQSNVTIFNLYHQQWFYLAVFLGFVFIFCLFLIAKVTANSGISVAQVANRMAVVIPISVAIIFYQDKLTIIKLIGIILALMAVYLVSKKDEGAIQLKKQWWLMPFVIFVSSGVIDSSINYAQKYLLTQTDFDAFLATIFLTAFVIGILIVLFQILNAKSKIDMKAIPSGLIIGVINFGTMYSIVQALNSNVLEPSVLFPINNLSILAVSTLTSVVIYKEKLSSKNWLGIAISLVAIIVLGILS